MKFYVKSNHGEILNASLSTSRKHVYLFAQEHATFLSAGAARELAARLIAAAKDLEAQTDDWS